jgi:hypothetical protein
MWNAKKLRNENLAEYILYMFQVEDLIRAFRFDENLIRNHLVTKYHSASESSEEIARWYMNLALMMQKEGLKTSGHLQFIINLINDFNGFHQTLLQTGAAENYLHLFQEVAGLITEIRAKNANAENDIALALDTIYGFLLLKLQKKEISANTLDAVKRLSRWMGILSAHYRDFEAGDLEI